jgi:hexosaminidase
MKTPLVCLAALVLAPPALGLIPQPVSVDPQPGVFRLHSNTAIVAPPGAPEARQAAAYLANAIAAPTGWQLKVSESTYPSYATTLLCWASAGSPPAPAHPEGYELVVTPRGIRIQSDTPAGLFYGVQTLLQLLPPEIESRTRRDAAWTVPCVHIADYPRFAWRGLMLDVSRHFFSKEFVEQYIDRMARYKMNVFHWHLTDDNGWRIEIKGLPQLTQVGAWRVPRLAASGAPAKRRAKAKPPPMADSTRRTTSAK